MAFPWTVPALALGLALTPSGDDPLPEGALVRLGSWTLRHKDPVLFAFFSPGGLVSGAMDGQVALWDPEDGDLLERVSLDQGSFTSGAPLPGGGGLFARPDPSLYRWTPGGDLERVLEGGGPMVSTSPDGKLACLTGTDATATLFEVETGAVLREVPLGELIAGRSAFSPDGALVAVASVNRNKLLRRRGTADQLSAQLHLIRTAGEIQMTIPLSERFPRALAFTPDGDELVTVDDTGGLSAWRVSDGGLRFSWQPEAPLPAQSLALTRTSADGPVLAALGLGDGSIHLVPLTSEGPPVRTLRARPPVNALAFTDDGSLLAAASAVELRLWRVADGAELLSQERHVAPVSSVAWSEDGGSLLSGSYDRSLRLWHAKDGAAQLTVEAGQGFVYGAALTSDHLWAAGQDGQLRGFTHEGELALELPLHKSAATDLGLSPDGKRLATAGADGALHILDAESGETLHTVAGLPGLQFRLAWSHDSTRLAVASSDVRVFDAGTGELLRTLPNQGAPVTALAWSPDGRVLAQGQADRIVRLFDLESADTRFLHGHTGRISAVAFSPDGTRIASASHGETGVRLWDAATQRATGGFDGHLRQVLSLAWDPAGERLASGSMDGTVLVWDARPPEDED